ncbi:coiled-coil domain-containing protein [Paenibacillus thermoaerophilus]|uniref:Coiled-coil domain-containing protein n=1 Tax=Paenibacillus thermoaerophilus TaxID=1215385 RepID=A0ABW2VA21_9BACL|nr:hypothetical protein [Paenibacillus thermoaerophilus]TMV06654.1 hypothetical protein FE781_16475 [Paenibacillus thermoaerophilus]
MKKVLLLCAAVFLLLGQTVFAQQENQKAEFDSIKAKKELVAKHADKKKNLSEEEMNQRTREVERKLNELAAGVAAGKLGEEEAKVQLEAMDVYMLEVPNQKKESGVTILSSGSDIYLNSVWITYDSITSRWTVTGGGYWNNTNWFNDGPSFWWGYVGETKNVGGVDAVGITYYNTSGTYNTAVISSLGYVTDHNGWSDYLYNPSHGNGRYGVAFDFQDKMRVQKVGGLGPSPDDFTYYGSGFSATITYDSNFTNYNGYARTMYAHTWDTTTINSIGFSGGGGQYGVDISWSSSSNRFVVFNGSDTVF